MPIPIKKLMRLDRVNDCQSCKRTQPDGFDNRYLCPDCVEHRVPPLRECRKCKKKVLQGLWVHNEFVDFVICQECETEDVEKMQGVTPIKKKMSGVTPINKKIHKLDANKISRISFDKASCLQGGIYMYLYNVMFHYKPTESLHLMHDCTMHARDLFKLLIACNETKGLITTYDKWLKQFYVKELAKKGEHLGLVLGSEIKIADNFFVVVTELQKKKSKSFTVVIEDDNLEEEFHNDLLKLMEKYPGSSIKD